MVYPTLRYRPAHLCKLLARKSLPKDVPENCMAAEGTSHREIRIHSKARLVDLAAVAGDLRRHEQEIKRVARGALFRQGSEEGESGILLRQQRIALAAPQLILLPLHAHNCRGYTVLHL